MEEDFLQLWALLLKKCISCHSPYLIAALTVVDWYSPQAYIPGFYKSNCESRYLLFRTDFYLIRTFINTHTT